MKIGTHTAKRTGLNAEFRKTIINGDPVYLTKIKNKIYKFSEQEFFEKWKPALKTRATVRQGEMKL